MFIGKRISKLRQSTQMSLEELYEGIVIPQICDIEAGRFEPSEDILILLAKRLEVPQEYFVDFAKSDPDLEDLLFQFKTAIEEDLQKAKHLLNRLHMEYAPYIPSVQLESYFFLLESYFSLKVKETEKGIELFTNQFLPLIEEEEIETFPTVMKEVYYYVQGFNHFNKKDHLSSYQYYLKQLPLISNNKIKADIWFNITQSLLKIYEHSHAITSCHQAVILYLKEQRWEEVAETQNLLGVLYWEMKDLLRAEEELLKALKISQLNNISNLEEKIYHNLGLIYNEKQEYTKSLEFFSKSLDIKKRLKGESISLSYRSILNIYVDQGLTENIEPILNEAKSECFDEKELVHLKVIEAKSKLISGNNYLYESMIEEAIDYFYSHKLWKYLLSISEEAGDYFYNKQDYKRAGEYYRIAIAAEKHNYRRNSDEEVV